MFPRKRKISRDHLIAACLALCMTLGLFAWMPFMVAGVPGKKEISRKFVVHFYTIPSESQAEEDALPLQAEPSGKTEETDVLPLEASRLFSGPHVKKPLFPKKTALPSSPAFSLPGGGTGGQGNAGQQDFSGDVFQERPQYPPAARRKGIEGRVLVRFRVDADGRTRDISILEAEPKGVFDESVLKAVGNWRFRAGETGWLVVPVHFSLKDAS